MKLSIFINRINYHIYSLFLQEEQMWRIPARNWSMFNTGRLQVNWNCESMVSIWNGWTLCYIERVKQALFLRKLQSKKAKEPESNIWIFGSEKDCKLELFKNQKQRTTKVLRKDFWSDDVDGKQVRKCTCF